MRLPIYLDYAATTPVDPSVIAKMQTCLGIESIFGNPASNTHIYGHQARELIEESRTKMAELLHVEPREIIFTSGATEADNLALQGTARFYQNKGKHIITAKTEHKAVLDTCKHLELEGFEVTYLESEKNGLVDLDKFKKQVRKDTTLVSIMHVNNEIGVIQDIQAIGEICREHNIIFHVDAAQSAGKIPIDLSSMPVDLMSFSAHKLYGPKGIGALYVRRKPRTRLQPIIHGGGHEQGLRSGTLATHQIVGMSEAFRIAFEQMTQENQRILQLRNHLWNELKSIPGVTLNGDEQQRVPGNLNFSIAGVDGGALIVALKDIAISTGSACTSTSIDSSHVLHALGLSDELAHSSLRISIGRYTSAEEIDFTIQHLKENIQWLRSLSPAWDENSG